MALDISTLEAAVRAWVVAGVDDATVAVIFGQQSAPRPASPFVALWLLGIDSPDWEEPRELEEHAITALSQAARTFTVAGDQRRFYPAGGEAVVADSTGNDALYTVSASALVAGSTVVTVAEAIASASVDGVLTGAREVVGTRILSFQVECVGTDSLERAEAIRAAVGLAAVIEDLDDAGLTPYAPEAIVDATELLETQRELRAVFTVRFAAVSVEEEFVSTLERASITRTVLDEDGAGGTARTETATVDMDVTPYAP